MKTAKLAIIALALVTATSCQQQQYKGYQRRPYTVRGVRYYPMGVSEALAYNETGVASWYNESSWLGLVRGKTSLGEKVWPWSDSGAHKTLPLPCRVRVTNLANGKSVVIRVNDRGPFVGNRIIDLSESAADAIGMKNRGLARVRVEVLSVGDGKYRRKG